MESHRPNEHKNLILEQVESALNEYSLNKNGETDVFGTFSGEDRRPVIYVDTKDFSARIERNSSATAVLYQDKKDPDHAVIVELSDTDVRSMPSLLDKEKEMNRFADVVNETRKEYPQVPEARKFRVGGEYIQGPATLQKQRGSYAILKSENPLTINPACLTVGPAQKTEIDAVNSLRNRRAEPTNRPTSPVPGHFNDM